MPAFYTQECRTDHLDSCASRHEITAGYNLLPVTLPEPTTFLYYSHLLQGARRVLKTILIECAPVAFGYVPDSTRNGDLTPETCTRQEASPCFNSIDRLRLMVSLHGTSASNYALSMASCSTQVGVLLRIEQSFDLVTQSDASCAVDRREKK